MAASKGPTVEPEEWVEPWDPKILSRFREEFGLTKAALERVLRRHPGLERTNWTQIHRWEAGAQVPHRSYQVAMQAALEAARSDPATLAALAAESQARPGGRRRRPAARPRRRR